MEKSVSYYFLPAERIMRLPIRQYKHFRASQYSFRRCINACERKALSALIPAAAHTFNIELFSGSNDVNNYIAASSIEVSPD